MDNKLEKLVGEMDYRGVGDLFSKVGYSEKDIIKQYGEFSEEARLYSLYLADEIYYDRFLEYKVPKHEIGPKITKKNLDNWIRDFCKQNDLKLPKGFSKKNLNQLRGMYGGMLNTYQIKKEDTFKHTSSIEPGFNIDGYNHAKKILNWSTNENDLRKLVYEVTKNEELSNSLDYNDLKHQYHRIFGVAKKILKSEE